MGLPALPAPTFCIVYSSATTGLILFRFITYMFLNMMSAHVKSRDQKHVFKKGCDFLDDNLKSVSSIQLKFGKWVCHIDVWK